MGRSPCPSPALFGYAQRSWVARGQMTPIRASKKLGVNFLATKTVIGHVCKHPRLPSSRTKHIINPQNYILFILCTHATITGTHTVARAHQEKTEEQDDQSHLSSTSKNGERRFPLSIPDSLAIRGKVIKRKFLYGFR